MTTTVETFFVYPDTDTVSNNSDYDIVPDGVEGWNVGVKSNGVGVAVAALQLEEDDTIQAYVCEYEAVPDGSDDLVLRHAWLQLIDTDEDRESYKYHIAPIYGEEGRVLVAYDSRNLLYVDRQTTFCHILMDWSSWSEIRVHSSSLEGKPFYYDKWFYATLSTPSSLWTSVGEEAGNPPTTNRATVVVRVSKDELIPSGQTYEAFKDLVVIAVLASGDATTQPETVMASPRNSAYSEQLRESTVVGSSAWLSAGKSTMNAALPSDGTAYRLEFGAVPRLRWTGRELVLPAGAMHVFGGGVGVDLGYTSAPQPYDWDSDDDPIDSSIRFTYQWTDRDGLMHESAPSAIYANVCETVTFRFTAPITNKHVVRIVPYILETDGLWHQMITTDWPSELTIYGKPNTRHPDAAADKREWSYRLHAAGFYLANPLLYTTGGVLENNIPRAQQCCCTHKGRVFYGHFRWLFYSHEIRDGYAPEFSDALFQEINGGGDIVQLASLGEALLIFKSDRVFSFYGQGPNRSGGGSDYGEPAQISGKGCVSPDSVVSTPHGVFFQSVDGINLIAPNGGVQPVGQAVEQELAAYPHVVGALWIENKSQARFMCSESEGSEVGICLVLDMTAGAKWSVFKYGETITEWVYQ